MENGADFLPYNKNSLFELWAWYKAKTDAAAVAYKQGDTITGDEITMFSKVTLLYAEVDEILHTPPFPPCGPVCLIDYNNPETQRRVIDLINSNQDAAALLTALTPQGSDTEYIKQLVTFGYLIGKTENRKDNN